MNVLSVDVEEYFHATEVSRFVRPQEWEQLPSRIAGSTSRVLDILSAAGVYGTFFVLGWVARRHPALVRRIVEEGHEIGCHSYSHRLIYELSAKEFKEDTQLAKSAIEDACGISPKCYRAPSFSLTDDVWWSFEILAELGFSYDSSIYPILHDRYGIPGYARFAHEVATSAGPIWEVPISTVVTAGGRRIPVGGGGYFRLFPYRYTSAGLRRLNEVDEKPGCFYIHPWELDPDQPRLVKGLLPRLRTYHGLPRTEAKLRRLLREFSFSTLSAVHERAASEALASEVAV